MILLEIEAKSKWCPMTRNVYNDGYTICVGHNDKGDGDSYCIASNCMLWVWIDNKGYCGLTNINGTNT